MSDFNLQYHPLLGEVSPRFVISEDWLQLFSNPTTLFNLQRENLLDSLKLSLMTISSVLGKILNGSCSSVSFLQNEELNNKRFYAPIDLYNIDLYNTIVPVSEPWDIYISSDLFNQANPTKIQYPIYNTRWGSFNEKPELCPTFDLTHNLLRSPNIHSIFWKARGPQNGPIIHFRSQGGVSTYPFDLNYNDPSKKL